jgi:ketosteroid isomerase-like protein
MAMPASERDEALAQSVAAARAATAAMMAGDSAPLQALFAPGDDVVVMGAFGGVFRGRAAVQERLSQTGQVDTGGERVQVEPVARWIGDDVACTVEVVRHEGVELAGHAPTTTAYRVTHVFRREGDGWKLVLRHADPLTDFRGPAAVLPEHA